MTFQQARRHSTRRTTRAGADTARRGLAERLTLSVSALDPRAAAGLMHRIGASPELHDVLAPLFGALLRERKAA